MILENTTKKGYGAYSPAYVSMVYHLPLSQIYLIESWLKETAIVLVETVKIMRIRGKNFQAKPLGEYDTSTL